MNNYDTLGMIKQRLEILYQMVDQLETGGGGGGGGTTDYNELSNKPSIAGQQLVGNKTLSELGAATPSDITDAFSPSTITLVEGGTFPSASRSLLIDHKPINVNDDQYYFLEESGVDYLYGSMPTSGAYPSLSYLRIMKSSFTVEFHNTGIDTVPTDGSDNLITSNAVYDAIQGGGGSRISDLVPVNIGNKVATFPEEYRYLLQKHLPFTFTPNYPHAGWAGNAWNVITEFPTSYICMAMSFSNNTGDCHYIFTVIQKTNWSWGNITPSSGSYQLINNIFFRQTQFGNDQVQTIAANDNLDNSQLGRFYCTAANAATLTNCPTTDAFYLIAEWSTSADRIQTITTDTAIPVVYRRVKTGGTWGSWYKFEGTVVS